MKAVNRIIQYIHEARTDPLAKQFAEGIVTWAGYAPNATLSNRQVMQAFLDYLRASVRYRPDPHMTETIQHPKITLCVPGAAACIPVEDCDGGACVLGWLMTGYGIPVRIVIEHFSGDTDHVLIEGQDDSGAWLACDFSNYNAENNPVGWKPYAPSETVIDPYTEENRAVAGARDVEFVAVGRIPERLVTRPNMTQAVTLGRLPPRDVAVHKTLGALAPAMAQSQADLENQVVAVVAAGDTYMNATPPEYAQAISAYKAAGQAGATSVGPEIDLAGASAVTQPMTHQAWTSNGDLQALSGTDQATAASAKLYITNMVALWQQAINDGSDALASAKAAASPGGPGGDKAISFSRAVAVVAVVGVVGGLVWASKRKR